MQESHLNFKKPCPHHSPEIISHICTYSKCQNRILCKECILNHSTNHKNFFVTLQVALNEDPSSDYDEVISKIDYMEKTREKKLALVDKFFDKLEKETLAILNRYRSSFYVHLHLDASAKDYESIKTSFENIKEHLNIRNKEEFAEAFTSLIKFKAKLDKKPYKLPVALEDPSFFSSYNFQDWIIASVNSYVPLPKVDPREEIQTKNPKYRLDNFMTATDSELRVITEEEYELEHLWAVAASNLSLEDRMSRVSVKSPNFSKYQAAFGNKLLKKGIHKWSFRFGSDIGCSAGIIPQRQLGGLDNFEWYDCYYVCGNGFAYNLKCDNEAEMKYKIVSVVLDLIKYKIEFYIEGKLYAHGPVVKDYYHILGFFAPNTTYGYVELLE